MATAKSSYLGELRVSSTHINSGTVIETDAPVDNHGKGTRFSPTDLLATAYLDCMITIMGIYCDNHNLEFKHCEGEVEKIMASSPRRVSQLNIVIDLSGNNWTEDEKKRVDLGGRPSINEKSVSPDLIANITFKY